MSQGWVPYPPILRTRGKLKLPPKAASLSQVTRPSGARRWTAHVALCSAMVTQTPSSASTHISRVGKGRLRSLRDQEDPSQLARIEVPLPSRAQTLSARFPPSVPMWLVVKDGFGSQVRPSQ